MGFRENLSRKIEIKRLAHKVTRSINPTDSGQRIEKEAMRQLLEMGTYSYQKERDLDLYRLNENHILLLDNELKIYNTTVEDVVLRKSPTVKEMVSIRNAIKILNDKDVVITRKAETVQRVRQELIDTLDLAYTEADIASMTNDGIDSIKNNYTEGTVEILTLFAELLSFVKAPKAFRFAHHEIWGKLGQSSGGDNLFGPMVIFNQMQNNLKIIKNPVSSMDREKMQNFKQITKGEKEADFSGDEAMNELFKWVMALPRNP